MNVELFQGTDDRSFISEEVLGMRDFFVIVIDIPIRCPGIVVRFLENLLNFSMKRVDISVRISALFHVGN